MNKIVIIFTLIILYLPLISFSQNAYASTANYSVSNTFLFENILNTEETIERQEHQLVSMINESLANMIEYPYEARELGNEGLIRAVVFISPDNSTAMLKIAKGNPKSFDMALIAAYKQLNFKKMVPPNYQGRRTIPVKITFELD